LGSVGVQAAGAVVDFVLVDMFASYCLGREDAKAQSRLPSAKLQRIYRSPIIAGFVLRQG